MPHLDYATMHNTDIDEIQHFITGINATIYSNKQAINAINYLLNKLDKNHQHKGAKNIPPYEVGLYEYLIQYKENITKDFETQADNLLKVVKLCGYTTKTQPKTIHRIK